MRGLILLATFLPLAVGCSVSRRIRPVDPPPQPPLSRLEQNLDYVDPDAGEPDYVIVEPAQ